MRRAPFPKAIFVLTLPDPLPTVILLTTISFPNIMFPLPEIPELKDCNAIKLLAVPVVTPVTAPVRPLKVRTPVFVIVTAPVDPDTAIPVQPNADETP